MRYKKGININKKFQDMRYTKALFHKNQPNRSTRRKLKRKFTRWGGGTDLLNYLLKLPAKQQACLFGLVVFNQVVPTIYATQAYMAHLFGPCVKTLQRTLYRIRDERGLVWLEGRGQTSNITHLHPLLESQEFIWLMHELFIYSSKPKGFMRQIAGYLHVHQEHFKNVLRNYTNVFEELTTKIKTIKAKGEEGRSPDEPSLFFYVDPPDPRNYVNIWGEVIFSMQKDPLLGTEKITPIPIEEW